MILTARQIRTARTFLDWTQEDLAAATGLNVSTIYKLESGKISPRGVTNNAICQAFEDVGLEIKPNGVQLRDEEITKLDGSDSCNDFLDDVMQTIHEKGGEIVCGFRMSALMAKVFNFEHEGFERLERLCEIAPVKCLVGDVPVSLPMDTSFQIRTAPKLHIGAVSFLEYGNKHAMILVDGVTNVAFRIYQVGGYVKYYRDNFYEAWEKALPIIMPGAQETQTRKKLSA